MCGGDGEFAALEVFGGVAVVDFLEGGEDEALVWCAAEHGEDGAGSSPSRRAVSCRSGASRNSSTVRVRGLEAEDAVKGVRSENSSDPHPVLLGGGFSGRSSRIPPAMAARTLHSTIWRRDFLRCFVAATLRSPEGLCGLATLADDFADVVLRDLEFDDDAGFVFERAHLDVLGIIDEGFGDVVDEFLQLGVF